MAKSKSRTKFSVLFGETGGFDRKVQSSVDLHKNILTKNGEKISINFDMSLKMPVPCGSAAEAPLSQFLSWQNQAFPAKSLPRISSPRQALCFRHRADVFPQAISVVKVKCRIANLKFSNI